MKAPGSRCRVLLAGLALAAGASGLSAQPTRSPAAANPGQAVKPGLTGAALDRTVARLLARMSLEEKVLQLLSNPPNGVPRLGIPNLRWGEVLHGVVADGATSFPQAIAMGSTWDPELIGQMGTVVSQEARALGVQQGYAPMLGLARDPRWGRVEESYGEDPYLTTQLGVAYIEGLQGMGADRFGPDRIFATPKHFVADGEPWAGANGEDYEISERVLREVYMPPFEAAVKIAKTESVMPAHHAINGVPSHTNPWLLQQVLRKEWGFTGYVTSDMGDIPKLFDGHAYAASPEDAAVMALKAGVDMDLEGGPVEDHPYAKYLPMAVRDGSLPVAVLDRAVTRVLGPKIMLLGLSEPTSAKPATPTKDEVLNYKGKDDIFAKLVAEGKETTHAGEERPGFEAVLNDPAHDRLALKVAQESIVLLKNERNLLPLDKDRIKRLLVVGPLADTVNLGGYSTGKPKFYVTALQGLKGELPSSAMIEYREGCTVLGGSPDQLQAAVAAAKDADVIVAVVGHTRAQLGENHDRDSLDLPGGQEQLIEAMQATGKPVVVVLNNGAPFALPWIHDHIPAVVESWYLGQSYGTALAQVLFGDVNPSGRLNVSFPVSLGQTPDYYNHPVLTGPILYDSAKTEFPYPFGKSNVLWAFGHGLSYTTFRYADLKFSHPAIDATHAAQVSATITNTGPRAGVEVVQLYIHQDHTSLKRPVEELKGFARIALAPGETRTVSFPVGFEQVKFWKDGAWRMEPGNLSVWIAAASDDLRLAGTLILK
jgi:beta-glucosidase